MLAIFDLNCSVRWCRGYGPVHSAHPTQTASSHRLESIPKYVFPYFYRFARFCCFSSVSPLVALRLVASASAPLAATAHPDTSANSQPTHSHITHSSHRRHVAHGGTRNHSATRGNAKTYVSKKSTGSSAAAAAAHARVTKDAWRLLRLRAPLAAPFARRCNAA